MIGIVRTVEPLPGGPNQVVRVAVAGGQGDNSNMPVLRSNLQLWGFTWPAQVALQVDRAAQDLLWAQFSVLAQGDVALAGIVQQAAQHRQPPAAAQALPPAASVGFA
jgi:hypothetical protein